MNEVVKLKPVDLTPTISLGEEFLTDMVETSKQMFRPNTRNAYERDWRHFVSWLAGYPVEPEKVPEIESKYLPSKQIDLMAYLQALLNEGKKQKTRCWLMESWQLMKKTGSD